MPSRRTPPGEPAGAVDTRAHPPSPPGEGPRPAGRAFFLAGKAFFSVGGALHTQGRYSTAPRAGLSAPAAMKFSPTARLRAPPTGRRGPTAALRASRCRAKSLAGGAQSLAAILHRPRRLAGAKRYPAHAIRRRQIATANRIVIAVDSMRGQVAITAAPGAAVHRSNKALPFAAAYKKQFGDNETSHRPAASRNRSSNFASSPITGPPAASSTVADRRSTNSW